MAGNCYCFADYHYGNGGIIHLFFSNNSLNLQLSFIIVKTFCFTLNGILINFNGVTIKVNGHSFHSK